MSQASQSDFNEAAPLTDHTDAAISDTALLGDSETPAMTTKSERFATMMFFILGMTSLSVFNIVLDSLDIWQYLCGSSIVSNDFVLFYNTPCLPVQIIFLLYLFHIPSGAQIFPAVTCNILYILFCFVFVALGPSRHAAEPVLFGLATLCGTCNAMLNASIFSIGGAFGSQRILGAIMAGQGLAGLAPSLVMLIINMASPGGINDGICYAYVAINLLLVAPAPFAAAALYRSPHTRHVLQKINARAYWTLVPPRSAAPAAAPVDVLGDDYEPPAPVTFGSMVVDMAKKFGTALKYCYSDALACCLLFTFTLSVYPSSFVSYDHSPALPAFFASVWQAWLCFAFVLSDYHGRSLTSRPASRAGRLAVYALAYVRIPVFFVLLMLFHKVFPHNLGADISFLGVIYVFGLSNGYCSTAFVGWGPTKAPSDEIRGLSGAFMSLALNAGLSIGAALSKLMQAIFV